MESAVSDAVLQAVPTIKRILDIRSPTQSAWAKAFKIDTLQYDDSEESYFVKVSAGSEGQKAIRGEYEATSLIHSITPDFCPKPVAWGTFKDADLHFYVCKFYDLGGELPKPKEFCESLANLHSHHASPAGRYGFHVTTYNGDLPQDNRWCDYWEEFFARGLKNVFSIREQRGGPSSELNALVPDLFNKVIPRLLRPLETGGRTIAPSLIHGDLWCGNTSTIKDGAEAGLIYDPASFWGHNEYELGNWRPDRNRFTQEYLDTYQLHYPKSQPAEDFDDRYVLYSIRFNCHAAALFPHQTKYLEMVIDDVRALVQKYPGGYVEWQSRVVDSTGAL